MISVPPTPLLRRRESRDSAFSEEHSEESSHRSRHSSESEGIIGSNFFGAYLCYKVLFAVWS